MGTPQTVWTVGHSNHAVETLLALVQRHEVARLIDVRSHPYSRYAPQFNELARVSYPAKVSASEAGAAKRPPSRMAATQYS
jgi:hypothetical protein